MTPRDGERGLHAPEGGSSGFFSACGMKGGQEEGDRMGAGESGVGRTRPRLP